VPVLDVPIPVAPAGPPRTAASRRSFAPQAMRAFRLPTSLQDPRLAGVVVRGDGSVVAPTGPALPATAVIPGAVVEAAPMPAFVPPATSNARRNAIPAPDRPDPPLAARFNGYGSAEYPIDLRTSGSSRTSAQPRTTGSGFAASAGTSLSPDQAAAAFENRVR
jgi:hypothetical protein